MSESTSSVPKGRPALAALLPLVGAVLLAPGCGGDEPGPGDGGVTAAETDAGGADPRPAWVPPAVPDPLPTYESPGVDGNGDPLPDGALQRLGTDRLRHGGILGFLEFREGPDGPELWSGASEAFSRAWDPDDGRLLRTLELGAGAWKYAGFDADGRLVVGNTAGQVRIVDPETGTRIAEYEELGIGLTIAPDGRRAIVSTVPIGAGQVFDLESGELGTSFAARFRFELSAWSPDGSKVASLSHNRNKLLQRAGTEHESTAAIFVWDPDEGTLVSELVSEDARLCAPRFSPDGLLVWCGDEGGRMLAWDAATGALVRTFGEGEGSPVAAVDVSPDGARVAVADQDGVLRILDAVSGEELDRRDVDPMGVHIVRFAPDGDSLLLAVGVVIRRIDLVSGEEAPVFPRHSGPVSCVAWSPDGATVATGGYDRTVRLWDAVSGEHLRVLEGHVGFVYDVQFTPDGQRVASVGQDGSVQMWDVESGDPVLFPLRIPFATTDLDFTPDGARALVACADKTVRVVDMATMETVQVLEGLTGVTPFAAWLEGGRRIVSASTDIRVVDAETWAEDNRIVGYPGMVTGFAVSPYGDVVLACLASKEVHLFGVDDGRTRHRLPGHLGRPTAAAFAPDGKRAATAARMDPGPRVWDVERGAELATLLGHRSEVLGMAFDPDGARLATAGQDGQVLIWSAPPVATD